MHTILLHKQMVGKQDRDMYGMQRFLLHNGPQKSTNKGWGVNKEVNTMVGQTNLLVDQRVIGH